MDKVKHILREEYGTWKLFAGSDGERQGWESLKKGSTRIVSRGPSLANLSLWTSIGACRMLEDVDHEEYKRYSVEDRQEMVEESEIDLSVLGFSLLASTFSFLIFFHSLANLPLSHNKLSELNVHSRFWMQLYCFIDVFSLFLSLPFPLTFSSWRRLLPPGSLGGFLDERNTKSRGEAKTVKLGVKTAKTGRRGEEDGMWTRSSRAADNEKEAEEGPNTSV
eukprot:763289-Hanusia_phi.AAC.5